MQARSTRYEITPVAKPRMTRQDKWPTRPPKYRGTHWPRPVVAKWFAFELEVVLRKVVLPPRGAAVLFILPMARSWSEDKKRRMNDLPHESTPDLSNLIKALEDACFVDDKAISRYAGLEKVWGYEGAIEIWENKPAVIDLGWANGWSKTPGIVKRCRDSVGLCEREHRSLAGFSHDHQVRCDTCGYVYKYNSS